MAPRAGVFVHFTGSSHRQGAARGVQRRGGAILITLMVLLGAALAYSILAHTKPVRPETPTANAVALVEEFLEHGADRMVL